MSMPHSDAHVKRQSAALYIQMEDIESALRRAVEVSGSARKAAEDLDLPPDAIGRVLSGKGIGSENLRRFRVALRLPADAPLRQSASLSGSIGVGVKAAGTLTLGVQSTARVGHSPDYWRGVLYAAEAMSETVTALLRQQREAAEQMAALERGALTPTASPERLEQRTADQSTPDTLADAAPARAQG